MLQDLVKLILLLAALALVIWLYARWSGKWFSDSSPVQVNIEPKFPTLTGGGQAAYSLMSPLGNS